MTTISAPRYELPIVDTETGRISREWYKFLVQLGNSVSGSPTLSDDLVFLAETDDASAADGNDARPAISDIERQVTLDDPQTTSAAADVAELQALSSSVQEDPVIARFTAQWDGLTPASGGGTANFLRADGAWAVPAYPTVPVGANPSASVGLSVVNGSAATFMRSDAAPPLSQGIAPTWTAQHIFSFTGSGSESTSALRVESTRPQIGINQTGAAADAKRWFLQAAAGQLTLQTIDDAETLNKVFLEFDRTGNAVSALKFGNASDNPTYSFLGTGTATLNGALKVVGNSGFNNTAPIAKPTVTGSKASNAALASLLTALANYGLVTDSST